MTDRWGNFSYKLANRALKACVFSSLLASALLAGDASACSVGASCNDDLSALLQAETNSGSHSITNSKAAISISVDGETLVGTSSRDDVNRVTDVDLESIDIQVKFDGLNVEKILSVSTVPEKRVHAPGVPIRFAANSNYPDWVARSEVRIIPANALGINPGRIRENEIVEVSQDGKASWTPELGYEGEVYYVYRVYDVNGRYDETEPLPIVLSSNAEALPEFSLRGEKDGRGLIEVRPAAANPAYDRNQINISNIPLHGGAVTVYGKNLPQGYTVNVLGKEVPVANGDDFVTQTILPPGEHIVDVIVRDESGERGVEFERDVNIPDNEWFYVGIADLTIGRRTGKDSQLLAPVKAGEYDDVYQKGRLAFYLKGKVKGRYIITASLDTTEEDLDTIFSNMDEKDPRQLLRRLDPDDYYPVYGDDSILKEDAPTSGKFYVRIDRGKSHVMWGNFKTKIDGVELARYERALYGAKANLESEVTTSFGEPVASVQAFAAQPGTLPQREEQRGTGGSVYFLKRQDINQGSEQISIEVRDASTGRVVERQVLSEGQDYSIDYVQGVIILSKPLASSTLSSSSVLPSSLASYEQYLVSNYEYTPTLGDVDGYSYGVRGEAWIADQFRFGVTGYEENTGTANQTLYGADVTWRLSEKSYFQLEWAQSEGDNFAIVTSTDGGIIFNPVSGDGVDSAAEAWRARMHLDMGELTGGGIEGSIGAGYEERDKGFNGPGKYASTDETIIDAHLELKPNEHVSVLARFDQVERDTGASKRDASVDLKVRLNEGMSVQVGALHSDTEGLNAPIDGEGARTDVGARVTWHGDGTDEFYVFGQGTVDRDSTRSRNDRIGVGFEADLTDKIGAEGQISYGTSGIGLMAGLSYEPTASDKYYIGYRMLPDISGGDLLSYDPFGRDNGTIVTGVRRKMSETVSAWTEHNFDMMGTSQGYLQSYGVEYTPDAIWKVSAGVEAGTIEDDVSGNFERIAPSFAIAYNEEGKTFGARL
ncbi:MAG: TonB-dependent receptor, partial [Salaquimonas sp.]